MKKIIYFITQSEFGGAQRYVFDLANNLKTEFQVAVAMGNEGNNKILAKILQKNNIEYFIIPHLKRSISLISDLLALREIIKLIKQYQPDIIHLNSSKISILGSIAAFIIKLRVASCELRVIYTVHGWVFNEPLPWLLKKFYLIAEKFTAKFKNKIICVSESDKRTALKNKIAPAEKLTIIHNGLAPIEFYTKQEARQKIFSKISSVILEGAKRPIESSQFSDKTQDSIAFGSRMTNNLLIGSIGNLYKTKGFEYFIEAASILMADPSFPRRACPRLDRGRESRFIIIGEGSERKMLEKLIAKYNLTNNFILAGQIDQAARLLSAFDIYVCSSVKEGLPYSVLEAMAAGLPIISTEVGGIPEMIETEKTGLLVKPANARQLAEKIKLLIDDKALRQKLGARAQTKVKAEFSLKKMVEATRKVYLS